MKYKLFLFICFSPLASCIAQFLSGESQTAIQNPHKHFDGIYLGVKAGTQNVFGGSYVDGIDVLAQQSKFVVDGSAGYRKQFIQNRVVVSGEFQFGLTNGKLEHKDLNYSVKYQNNTQWGIGLTLGMVLGKRKSHHIYVYSNETTRKFDVTIIDQYGPYYQQDEQGMVKYGIGFETHLFKKWNLQATLGKLRVDFGNRVTNIELKDKVDAMIGVVYQF